MKDLPRLNNYGALVLKFDRDVFRTGGNCDRLSKLFYLGIIISSVIPSENQKIRTKGVGRNFRNENTWRSGQKNNGNKMRGLV